MQWMTAVLRSGYAAITSTTNTYLFILFQSHPFLSAQAQTLHRNLTAYHCFMVYFLWGAKLQLGMPFNQLSHDYRVQDARST